jgi:outer membrane protein assembly factor BamA
MRGEEVYELSSLPRERFLGHLILYASLRYQDYTRLNYFGLGSDTSADDRTTYRLSGSRYELVAGWQFTPRLAVTLRGGYWTPDVRSGTNPDVPSVEEVFTEANTPGLTTQPDFLMTTAQVFFDTRDKPGAPRRGAMIALQASRFDPRGSDEFRFRRYSGDLRGFVPLGSRQRVLALRTYFAIDNADASKGRNVPFYLQDSLGGSRTLRGYDSFRFRGTDTLLFQAEYRWEPWPPLELALFGDAGRVAALGDDLSLSGLRGDYGVGLRVKSARGVVLRFDVAFGGEANRFYVRFGSGW